MSPYERQPRRIRTIDGETITTRLTSFFAVEMTVTTEDGAIWPSVVLAPSEAANLASMLAADAARAGA